MSGNTGEPYEGWAIIELMGHRRLAGLVRQAEQYGVAMLRVDVPGEDGETMATQFYGGASIYCLTPTTEEMARAVALRNQPAPVQRWELPAPKPPIERTAVSCSCGASFMVAASDQNAICPSCGGVDIDDDDDFTDEERVELHEGRG